MSSTNGAWNLATNTKTVIIKLIKNKIEKYKASIEINVYEKSCPTDQYDILLIDCVDKTA